jgi:aminopeptidase N
MLRWELGDEIFFEILRKYYDKYKYSNASTDDFRRICELVSGIELTHFFDQWVKNVGMIELSYDWATEQFGDSCFTFLEINQEQKEYEEYHFSLEIALQYENNIEYRRLFINKKAMQFRLSSKQIPDDVLIDPKNNLLIISQQK